MSGLLRGAKTRFPELK